MIHNFLDPYLGDDQDIILESLVIEKCSEKEVNKELFSLSRYYFSVASAC